MKNWYFILPFVILSCVNHENQEPELIPRSDQSVVEIKYAEGFEILEEDGNTKVLSHSIGQNEAFRDSLMLLHPGGERISGKWISSRFYGIACQSSTHLAFLDVIGVLDLVDGHCGLEYIVNPDFIKQLELNDTKEICAGERTEMEAILEVNPDLYFVYPFGKTEQLRFEESGITTFYIAEYLETSQLGRLEWIKLFGVIFGKLEEAKVYFNQVEEEYNSLKVDKQDPSKTFILNLPYKDTWFMPSSQSLTVKLMEDAGLTYFYADESSTENSIRSTETVWKDGMEAPYWIIMASRPADYSLADLIQEEPVYADFKSVKEGKVIFCNTSHSDYFSKGVVEPHIMLKDILFASEQLSWHEPKYFFQLK